MKHDDDVYWDRVIGGLILVMGCLIIGVLLNRLVSIDWHPKPHVEAITIVPAKPIHIPKPMEWPPEARTDGLMLDLNWYPTIDPPAVTNVSWWRAEQPTNPWVAPPQVQQRMEKTHARHVRERRTERRQQQQLVYWTDGRDSGPAPTGRR